MVRKLVITKDDTPDRVIELLAFARDEAVTITAPRGSKLADREGLARLREAAADRGIEVSIESVDEELLSLAHTEHIETVHPFFRADRRTRNVDGVVAREHTHPQTDEGHTHIPVVMDNASEEPVVEEDEEDDYDDEDLAQEEIQVEEEETHTRTASHNHEGPSRIDWSRRGAEDKKQIGAFGWFLRIGIPLLGLAVLGVAVGELWMRSAAIEVSLNETPFSYAGSVTVSTSITGPSTENGLAIPGQIFESQKNIAQPFPATGEPGEEAVTPTSGKDVKITVHNTSGEAQTFVTRTRFAAGSGIFRATQSIPIPAGTADKPGTVTINATPDSDAVFAGAKDGERLSIPGLAGSSRESSFYGILDKPEVVVAETPSDPGSTTSPSERVVTDTDVSKAQEAIEDILGNSFKASLIATQPDLIVLDGALSASPDQLTVNREVNSEGNFTLVGQGSLEALAFREDDLRKVLVDNFRASSSLEYDLMFRTVKLTYDNIKVDFEKGTMTVDITAEGVLVGDITEEMIRTEAQGKSKSEVKAWAQSNPAIASFSAKVSPFWRSLIPANKEDVSIAIK